MLCCPDRPPRKRSSRLPGGTLSSRSVRTRFSCVSFRRTTGQRATGQAHRARRVCLPLNKSSVAWSEKERITESIITASAIRDQTTVVPVIDCLSPRPCLKVSRHHRRALSHRGRLGSIVKLESGARNEAAVVSREDDGVEKRRERCIERAVDEDVGVVAQPAQLSSAAEARSSLR